MARLLIKDIVGHVKQIETVRARVAKTGLWLSFSHLISFKFPQSFGFDVDETCAKTIEGLVLFELKQKGPLVCQFVTIYFIIHLCN